MKLYKQEDVIAKAPEGTTHISYNPYSFDYIKHSKNGYRVWLGVKHGGWSFKFDFNHRNYNSLIELKDA